MGIADKGAEAKADRALALHEQGLTRAQLAERFCVNPRNVNGMLHQAKNRRDKICKAVNERGTFYFIN
jgi:DNA-binding transcriptional regulator LsrR (DeoR family)